MVHLLSLKPYVFPRKDKWKYYNNEVKDQGRKLVEFASFKHNDFLYLMYRPVAQTAYGVKKYKFRLTDQKYFPSKSQYHSILQKEYNELEKQVITTCWLYNTAHFIKELKTFLKRVEEAYEYESQQRPNTYEETLYLDQPSEYD
ncbi:MAG: hypothetical protein AAFO07_04185 [Bacteroidota bacterium]